MLLLQAYSQGFARVLAQKIVEIFKKDLHSNNLAAFLCLLNRFLLNFPGGIAIAKMGGESKNLLSLPENNLL